MLTTISGSKLADCSNSIFGKLDSLARKSGLIARFSSRFSAAGFVLSLLKAVITGKTSFNQLAINLGESELNTVSRQALWARINTRAISFLLLVIGEALAQRWSSQNVVNSSHFTRILIQDSSQAKLPKSNAEEFPAHGNGAGKTAGCKCDFAFDLLTGEPVLQSLQLATTQDRDLGKNLVDLVRKGDLVLRDMGYFSIDEFERIHARHAHWLSRVPISVTLCDEQGNKIEALLHRTKHKKNRGGCPRWIGWVWGPTRPGAGDSAACPTTPSRTTPTSTAIGKDTQPGRIDSGRMAPHDYQY